MKLLRIIVLALTAAHTSVGLLAWERHATTLPPLDNPVVPVYLRKSQAEENLKAKNGGAKNVEATSS